MHNSTLRRARVRVPCSTSNLGAGFDCLGLALARYIEAEYEPGATALSVQRRGTAQPVIDARDFTRAAFLDELDRSDVGGILRVNSDIPLGRGLGSSAAATVAGLLLARAVLGEHDPERQALLQSATESEGHPDNAAPSLLGGLVAVARDAQDLPRAFRLALSDQVGFAFASPSVEVPTPLARRALPMTVAHRVASRALGRVAAVLKGFERADPELLRIGFNDELHVPFRLPFIPRGEFAIEAGLDAGAWAVTISGSGSGLIAVCPTGQAGAVAAAMAVALQQEDSAYAFAAQPDVRGGTIEIDA